MGLGPTDRNGDGAAVRRFSRALEGGLHPRSPGNAVACHVCRKTSAELCHLAAAELMSRATVSPVGLKTMRPLIKLQQYQGTGSLDTFLYGVTVPHHLVGRPASGMS